jgi:hypothetical protein
LKALSYWHSPLTLRSSNRRANPPPRDHQTGRNAVPSRDLRHHCPGRQRLDDPHLVVARPATPTLNPAQNFCPHQPTLGLALKPHGSSQTGHRTRRPAAEGYGTRAHPQGTRPSLQNVVERFGQVMPTREFDGLLADVGLKILDQRPWRAVPFHRISRGNFRSI